MKLTIQLLDTEGERDGTKNDKPKGVSITMGSQQPLLQTLNEQNSSGTSAPISKVTEAPFTIGKTMSFKYGKLAKFALAGIKLGQMGMFKIDFTLGNKVVLSLVSEETFRQQVKLT